MHAKSDKAPGAQLMFLCGQAPCSLLFSPLTGRAVQEPSVTEASTLEASVAYAANELPSAPSGPAHLSRSLQHNTLLHASHVGAGREPIVPEASGQQATGTF